METLALFGATGNTGRNILEKALRNEGYNVRAMVRNPKKIDEKIVEEFGSKLTLIQGELSNVDAIRETITNSNYIIVCAGPTKIKTYPKDLMLNFVKSLWSIIKEIEDDSSKPKVIVYQSGAMTPLPDGTHPMKLKIMSHIVPMLVGMSGLVEDNKNVHKFIDENPLTPNTNVVVTRPGQIEHKKPGSTEEVKLVGSDEPEGSAITFEDLAAFDLSAIKDESLYGKYPFVKIVK